MKSAALGHPVAFQLADGLLPHLVLRAEKGWKKYRMMR
jgi:hypothetical protein